MKKILFLLIMLISIVSISACQMVYECAPVDEWSFDQETHWHACFIETCDDKFNEEKHTYGDWELKDGSKIKVHKCTVCGYSEEELLEDGEHIHTPNSSWSNNELNHWHTCGGCDELLDKAEHSWGPEEIITDATVDAPGLKATTCTICLYKKEEVIPQLVCEHVKSEEWTSDDDNHWHTCANCSELFDKAPHGWDNGNIIKEPTATEMGEKVYTCGACGKTKTEYILNNIFSGKQFVGTPEAVACITKWSTYDFGYTTLTDGKAPAETDGRFSTNKDGILDGTIDLLGEYKINELKIHLYKGNSTTQVGETLTIELLIDGVWTTVVDCKSNSEVAAAKNGEYLVFNLENKIASQVRVKAKSVSGSAITFYEIECYGSLEHMHVDANWSSDDDNHYKVCSSCNKQYSIGAHVWDDGVLTKEPTSQAKGEKTYTCTTCNKTKIEYIDFDGFNVFDGKVFVGTPEAISCIVKWNPYDFGYTTLTDGKAAAETDGRFSTTNNGIMDGTIDLINEYKLSEIKFYLYKGNSTDQAGETLTIELLIDGVWTKVVDCKSNSEVAATMDGEYLVFNLGNKVATQVRIKATSVSGKAITFYEVLCYGSLEHAHNDSDWSSDDNNHYKVCSSCNKQYSISAHTWDAGVVTKEPTTTTAGEKTFTCTTCGKTKVEAIGFNVLSGKKFDMNTTDTAVNVFNSSYDYSKLTDGLSGGGRMSTKSAGKVDGTADLKGDYKLSELRIYLLTESVATKGYEVGDMTISVYTNGEWKDIASFKVDPNNKSNILITSGTGELVVSGAGAYDTWVSLDLGDVVASQVRIRTTDNTTPSGYVTFHEIECYGVAA